MPQHMRRQLARPGRQVPLGGLGQRPAEHIRGRPRAGAVPALALGGEQRGAGPGVVGVELAPHVLDEPAQVPVRAVDQRHQPRLRPPPPRALAVPDVELAEPAQLPPHVVQVQHAGLVDPQADVGRQPGGGVVPGGRGELAAGRQLPAPPGEQLLDLLLGRRHAQLRVDRGPRPVHLIQRALGHAAGQVVDLDLVPQLQELEVHRQRGRPAGPRRRPRIAQHLAEVRIGVRRLHLPQRPAEPVPDQLQVAGVVADRAVGQPRRGPRQHEPGQHVGLESGELFRARRRPMLTQVTHQRQSQPAPPRLHLRRQTVILDEIISRRLRKDQNDSPAAG